MIAGWDFSKKHKYADYNPEKEPLKRLVFETIEPKTVTKTANSITADFGSIYAGYLQAEASGKKDDIITLLFAQELDNTGDLRYNLRADCKYKEEWILSGKTDKLEEYDYKSFRCAKILFPEGTKIEDIKFTIRHYPFTQKKQC